MVLNQKLHPISLCNAYGSALYVSGWSLELQLPLMPYCSSCCAPHCLSPTAPLFPKESAAAYTAAHFLCTEAAIAHVQRLRALATEWHSCYKASLVPLSRAVTFSPPSLGYSHFFLVFNSLFKYHREKPFLSSPHFLT